MQSQDLEQLFINIGLEPKFVATTLKNKKVCQNLLEVIETSGLKQCEKKIGSLLYNVATTLPQQINLVDHKKTLIKYISTGKIGNNHRYNIAVDYLKQNNESQINIEEFDRIIGVGIEITEEDIKKTINDVLKQNQKEVNELRYTLNITNYLKILREKLPFAEAGQITKLFQAQLESILGPQTEKDKEMKEDLKKKQSDKDKHKVTGQLEKLKQQQQQQENFGEEKEEDNSTNIYDIKNFVARDLGSAVNSKKLMEEHLKVTGGKVYTRFPPEPNGYIHIGHAKAMRFSFMVAKQNGGECYLRFDDTNPDKESQEYIDNIIENMKWLGYTPFKITYSSEYFPYLHEMAIKLIKKGKAYVCNQNKAQMSDYRNRKLASPNRNKSIEQNLKEFEMMRLGMYEEGEVMLRLKIDFESSNTTMRDPVIYRIKYTTHPHVGDKWCIYPCYDFTHCLCDSLENITHSLCTLEFEVRRDLYYWILEQCEVYRPQVWEYSRMNLSNTVVSKRKLQQLVFDHHVNGWDDPRLSTINGLRRKGYTASAINRFCDSMSVTRRGNENFVNISLLENALRQELDITSDRTMAVLDPVKLEIINYQKDLQFDAPLQPKNPARGNYKVTLQKYIYVDRKDVKDSDKEQFGIFENRFIGLKYAGQVLIKEIVRDENKQVVLVKAEYHGNRDGKAQGFMHWISDIDAITCQLRLFEHIITAYNPNEAKELTDIINPHSLILVNNAKVNKNAVLSLKPGKSIQFERIGYFCHDKDSKPSSIILNRSAALGELKEK